jgi:AAA family ATP:ADP antiporter
MLQTIKKNFFDIRKEEWPLVISMSLYFFIVIGLFWVLKPIKRGLLVNTYQENPLEIFGMIFAGAEVEQIAKVVNMLVVYLVVIIFSLLSNMMKRTQLNLTLSVVFGSLFLIFAFLLQNPGTATAWSLYVYGDMFNSAMVTFFWAFSNDIFNSEQAKRLYGLVGLGGILGGIVGATFVTQWVEITGRTFMMFVSILPVLVLAAIGFYVEKKTDSSGDKTCCDGNKNSQNAVYEGAKLVLKSKYLLAIVGILGIYEMVSNIVDFQLSAVIAREVEGALNKDAYFGLVGQITNIISLFVQVFLTSFVMKRFGVGIALLFLPVVITAGSIGFFILPGLAFVTVMSVGDNSLNYSINQSAKETLYTPLSRNMKYKAKAFIDMFIQRFAKVLAVVLNLVFAAYIGLEQVEWLSAASLLLLGFWIWLIIYVGKSFRDKSESSTVA